MKVLISAEFQVQCKEKHQQESERRHSSEEESGQAGEQSQQTNDKVAVDHIIKTRKRESTP